MNLSHLLFFGSVLPPEECQRNPACPFSANRFQYELLNSLQQGGLNRVTAISPQPSVSYPRDRRLWIRGQNREAHNGLSITSPGYVNLGVLKVLSSAIAVYSAAVGAVRRHGKPQAILLYNPYPGYALSALLLARRWRIPAVAVVADLNPSRPWSFRGLARQILDAIQCWSVTRFDGLLPFSVHVARDLNFRGPSLRLDPGIDPADFVQIIPLRTIDCSRTIAFSGTLNSANGLPLLLKAFAEVRDPNLELWITGRGDMQVQVEECARHDSRIRYYGFLERSAMLELLSRSTVLVNPRPSSLPEHRYNFPSKVLEYLAVGRPIISTATADLAEEYGEYVYLLQEDDPVVFGQFIETVCAKEPAELDAVGQKGRQYVLNEKNWTVLGQQVFTFLAGLVEK